MAAEKQREQISVTLDRELREEIERVAAAEHRSVSAQVRHLVAVALAKQAASRLEHVA